MLRPRIIPCLLIQNGGLVKTIRFANPKYVGDPINAVRIYNEKEVDELVVIDIDATVKGFEPNYQLISRLASECRMPLCYGGGVRTADQVEKIISLGVEKVAISSAATESPELITDAALRIGSQSVVVVMDVKKLNSPSRYEVVVNSVDCDGEMKGYDFKLIDQVRDAISLPMTVMGGAGSLEDLKKLFRRYGTLGAAARKHYLRYATIENYAQGFFDAIKGTREALIWRGADPEETEVDLEKH